MSNQVQCPNCGGYIVNMQNKTVIATEEKKQYTSFGGQLEPVMHFRGHEQWF
jgi:hypothetical protein